MTKKANRMSRGRKVGTGFLFALVFIIPASPAKADFGAQFKKFQPCPWEDVKVKKCIYVEVQGGEIKLGTRTVPIENPVLINGGIGETKSGTKFAPIFDQSDGPAMEEVPQNVPGGLLGIDSGNPSSPIARALTAALFENSLLGLQVTMEPAGSKSEMEISQENMTYGEGAVLRLPARLHLENPLLGPECFVGSAADPLIWNLRTGKTDPPAPNTPIKGAFGKGSFLAEGLILDIKENKLVDNAWRTPRAHGCGGPLSSWIDPIVNAQLAKAVAGRNTTILENTLQITSAAALKYVEEKES